MYHVVNSIYYKKEKPLKMKGDVGMACQKVHKQGRIKVMVSIQSLIHPNIFSQRSKDVGTGLCILSDIYYTTVYVEHIILCHFQTPQEAQDLWGTYRCSLVQYPIYLCHFQLAAYLPLLVTLVTLEARWRRTVASQVIAKECTLSVCAFVFVQGSRRVLINVHEVSMG